MKDTFMTVRVGTQRAVDLLKRVMSVVSDGDIVKIRVMPMCLSPRTADKLEADVELVAEVTFSSELVMSCGEAGRALGGLDMLELETMWRDEGVSYVVAFGPPRRTLVATGSAAPEGTAPLQVRRVDTNNDGTRLEHFGLVVTGWQGKPASEVMTALSEFMSPTSSAYPTADDMARAVYEAELKRRIAAVPKRQVLSAQIIMAAAEFESDDAPPPGLVRTVRRLEARISNPAAGDASCLEALCEAQEAVDEHLREATTHVAPATCPLDHVRINLSLEARTRSVRLDVVTQPDEREAALAVLANLFPLRVVQSV